MPILETREQLLPRRHYLWIRLDDQFGFEEIVFASRPREHKHIARATQLYRGRTPEGKLIVTDGGRMTAFADHVEISIDVTGSTQVEAIMGINAYREDAYAELDRIMLPVRQESCQKLATLLGMPVEMDYVYTSVAGKKVHSTFTP